MTVRKPIAIPATKQDLEEMKRAILHEMSTRIVGDAQVAKV